MKGAKVEKSVLQPHLDKLLQLKAQLAAKQGPAAAPPAEKPKRGKSKAKK